MEKKIMQSKRRGRPAAWFVVMAAVALSLMPILSYAEDGNSARPPAADQQLGAEPFAWTPEMMKDAQPYPMPIRDLSNGEPSSAATQEPLGAPGAESGTLPGGKKLPSVGELLLLEAMEPAYTPPGNWLTSYPGPFQRWTWFGNYLAFPTSTIGKLFFQQDHDGDGFYSSFVCSASVIYGGGSQADVIATAGHCVNNGLNGAGANGGWSRNVSFCPSYYAGGVHPSRGCWNDVTLWTKTIWFANSNSEGDLGCVVAQNSGTIVNNHVGNVTGTLGRAWNWGAEQMEMAFGYPAAAPFPGYHIISVAGPDWYTYSWGAEVDVKYMGNDMTGGSSGGPWILGWGHRSAEWPDTDASNSTDPLPGGAGWLNGVNSHKIIYNGVLRTQEMGSPQLVNYGGADAEGLWAACQASADSD